MFKTFWVSAFVVAFVLGSALAGSAQDDKASAESWFNNASQTKDLVWGVINEVRGMGVEEDPVALGSVTDAEHWAKLGDDILAKGQEAMDQGDYQTAAQQFGQAWQYYVKAGSSAVRSKMLLTSK